MKKMTIMIAIAPWLFCVETPEASATDYLSSAEIIGVTSATAGVSVAGAFLRTIPPEKEPVIRGHLPFEQSFQRWLGGKYKFQKKNNFLDTKLGAFATPFAAGLTLTIVNLAYPRNNQSKDLSQDLFLFTTGALATKGVTDLAKGIFARERPFMHVTKNKQATESMYERSFIQHSFFSGHTSSAFFSTAFLNLRIRETMRRRMTNSEYQSWRWVSSGVLYGWASFVGLGRIQSYKHHPSDVLVGALAGVLMAELFYSLDKHSSATSNPNYSSPIQFQLTIPLSSF